MNTTATAPASTEIASATPYVVIDTHTGLEVYRTTYANRKRARSVADRKDNAYGAVRFVCRLA